MQVSNENVHRGKNSYYNFESAPKFIQPVLQKKQPEAPGAEAAGQ
jgi:hypothetical protein